MVCARFVIPSGAVTCEWAKRNLSAEMDHVVVSSDMWEGVFVTPTPIHLSTTPTRKGLTATRHSFPDSVIWYAVEITPNLELVWELDERSWIVIDLQVALQTYGHVAGSAA